MTVTTLPALADNYIYLITDEKNRSAAVVDPGESAPVLKKLQESNLALETILVTHKHADHIDGIGEIIAQHPQAKIITPPNCTLPPHDNIRIVAENDNVELFGGALTFSVIHTPGHTLEHIAYYGDGLLFCGDTLFPCGCGRVFEGTFAQMQQSVEKLINLPPSTLAYCGHEYTQKNIAFAQAAEPNNAHLRRYADAAAAKLDCGQPTSPFAISDERECNPFARVREPSLIAALKQHGQQPLNDESAEAVFAALRRWKDNF